MKSLNVADVEPEMGRTILNLTFEMNDADVWRLMRVDCRGGGIERGDAESLSLNLLG